MSEFVMPPVGCGVQAITMPNGRQQVILQFQTIYGVTSIPFEPKQAIEFANEIKRQARTAATGLTVVESRAGGGVLLRAGDD